MEAIREVVLGDRRLTLGKDQHEWYGIRMEVWAEGAWHDISFQADQRLSHPQAKRRFAQRLAEAEQRARYGVFVPQAHGGERGT